MLKRVPMSINQDQASWRLCRYRSTRSARVLVLATLAFAASSVHIAAQLNSTSGVSQFVGTRSCAATGCHGSSTHTVQPWRRSFHVWWQDDPHAAAYRVLFDPAAVAMVGRLNAEAVKRDDAYRKYLQQNCNACHATPQPAQPLVSDPVWGVSCESCHGAAGNWLVEHTQPEWLTLSSDRKRELGFRETRPLLSRAATCASCHVGEIDATETASATRRVVTHDLIAAGHPPLRFEFAAYYASLPNHWAPQADESRAEHWLAGQRTTLNAHLELLEQRVDESQRAREDQRDGEYRHVWPEFAEYSCYSCHHRLAHRSHRRERGNSAGSYDWGSWSLAMSRLAGTDRPELNQLRAAMTAPWPAANRVLSPLSRLLPSDRSAMEVPRIQVTRKTLQGFFQPSGEPDRWDWDRSVQWLLGFEAFYDTYAVEHGSDREILGVCRRLRNSVLSFPAGFLGPRDYESDPDTWRKFQDGRDELQRLVEQLE